MPQHAGLSALHEGPAAIVGGGPVGLILALFLDRHIVTGSAVA